MRIGAISGAMGQRYRFGRGSWIAQAIRRVAIYGSLTVLKACQPDSERSRLLGLFRHGRSVSVRAPRCARPNRGPTFWQASPHAGICGLGARRSWHGRGRAGKHPRHATVLPLLIRRHQRARSAGRRPGSGQLAKFREPIGKASVLTTLGAIMPAATGDNPPASRPRCVPTPAVGWRTVATPGSQYGVHSASDPRRSRLPTRGV
jgi:hypothetical protein